MTRPLSSWLFAAVFAFLCPAAVANPTSPTDGALQLVVVVTNDWDAPLGMMRMFERDSATDPWRQVRSERFVTVGRAGAAWGLGLNPAQAEGPQKREGDGRSPAGVFAIGGAFGYPPKVSTGLDYAAMDEDDWCVDVSGSPYYNRIVDASEVGADAVKASTEPMRRDLHANGDQRYRLGFVIEHNSKGVEMGGSCIFAHVWKSWTDSTAGCTAMSDEDMQALLGWLRADRRPRFVLLPIVEYVRLRNEWKLPPAQAAWSVDLYGSPLGREAETEVIESLRALASSNPQFKDSEAIWLEGQQAWNLYTRKDCEARGKDVADPEIAAMRFMSCLGVHTRSHAAATRAYAEELKRIRKLPEIKPPIPETFDCSISARELATLSKQDACVARGVQDRCNGADACLVRCLATGSGNGVGGGCHHLCARWGLRGEPWVPTERAAACMTK